MKHLSNIAIGLVVLVIIAITAIIVYIALSWFTNESISDQLKYIAIGIVVLVMAYFIGRDINKPTEVGGSNDLCEEEVDDIQCHCSEEEKHGETAIMCCNHCGLPTEKFWTNKSETNE